MNSLELVKVNLNAMLFCSFSVERYFTIILLMGRVVSVSPCK